MEAFEKWSTVLFVFHYYFWRVKDFCYLDAFFEHIEKEKYVEFRITLFVSTSKIISFLE